AGGTDELGDLSGELGAHLLRKGGAVENFGGHAVRAQDSEFNRTCKRASARDCSAQCSRTAGVARLTRSRATANPSPHRAKARSAKAPTPALRRAHRRRRCPNPAAVFPRCGSGRASKCRTGGTAKTPRRVAAT